MNKTIKLKRPGMGVGDRREYSTGFDLPGFDLYGRHHEVDDASAKAVVTKLAEGLHLDLTVTVDLTTTCDRTLEPVEKRFVFGESEFLLGPHDDELFVRDWELDVARYAEAALPSEVPMQVFAPGTEPVAPGYEGEDVDPRWSGLGDLFAATS
jgi:uncharacterized metal-binding protein YceD (DUF177 family)